jgi:hypothetical protein
VGSGLDDVDDVEDEVALVELADVVFPVDKGWTVVKTRVLRKPPDERTVVEAMVVKALEDGVMNPPFWDELF